jgi:hypothetical protein
VLDAIDLDVPADLTWDQRLAELLERGHTAMSAHPRAVPLLLTHRHASPGSLRWGEAVLAALAEGGFEGEDRVIAFRTLLAYVTGAVQVEQLGPLSGAGTAALAELPVAELPFLADTARHARRITPDREFRRGLTIVLRGVGVPAPGPPPPAGRGRPRPG